MTRLESDLEDEVVQWAKSEGGYAVKLYLASERGWADRTIWLPEGRVILPELKRPGKNDGGSINQKKWRRRLRELGFATDFCETLDEVKALL